MVDKTPDEAISRTQDNAAKNKKHLEDLQRVLGPVGGNGGELQVGTNQYGDLTLYSVVTDKKGREIRRDEIFFWVQPDGVTFTSMFGAGLIKNVKQLYKGNLEGLRQQLYSKNFLSEADYVTKNETALNEAILNAGRNYSLGEVQKYTVEGQTRFNSFGQWISGLGSVPDEENLPVRDINLMDRDVIEALVRDVYSRTTDMAIDDAFLKQETDRYMKQIKEGTLTTVTKSGGEMIRKTTTPFSQAQVEAELPKRIKEERPGATNYKTNFDFLAFLNSLGADVV